MIPVHRSRICRFGVAALFAAAVWGPGPIASADEPTVSLRWALGARDTEGAELNAIKQDTTLDSGARLKFLVEPLSPGSVYLILLDSSDDIHVLYRSRPEPETAAGAEPSYIPPGKKWFELDDHAGLETFFLLASTEPLSELDGLLDRLEAADDMARKALAPEVVGEIRRLHKEHRKFSRPVEKPVMIGGQTRGNDGGSIDHLAVEITAERFYGKTITIDH